MATDIDLRDCPPEDCRDRLFGALDDATDGEELAVVADPDPDPHLVRYQIDRDRRLAWAHAHPDAEPRELTVIVDEPLGGALGDFDVRDLKPQRRHDALLSIFEELAAGEGFVLVNDHDPKPLYHELRSTHGDVVDWEYAATGDGEWRVEIRKTAPATGDAGDVVTRFDVREIPKAERHPTIHHRYGMIPEGATMELVAPHEPRPLQREFRQRYGDAFEWSVVESEPGRVRVQVTKEETVDETAGQGGDAAESGESPTGDAAEGGDDQGNTVDAAPAAEESIAVTTELDVRDRPPAERHELIFEAYSELSDGEGFVLVNDHDPKPLYHQFEAEAGPEFRWEYRSRDPGEFRVLIGRAESASSGRTPEEPEAPF